METQKVIATLNNLLETTNDGASGFRACAEDVKNPQLKTIFQAAAARCEEGAAELEDTIIDLGGEPASSGTASGTLHRAWTNIISTISGMDEGAVLAECERGKDFAKRTYESALQEDLPPEVKSIVRRQYQGVKDNRDRIRELRERATPAGNS